MNVEIDLKNVSEIELSYKRKTLNLPKLVTSSDAFTLLINSWDENKVDFVEQAKVILLNRSRRVLGILELSSGGVAGTIVDPKLIFVAALKGNASSIILAHNHPSGNLKPSLSDEKLTQKIKEAGDFLNIQLDDHLIISRDGYYSFADEYG